MHRKDTCQFFRFSTIFARPRFVKIHKFRYHDNVTYQFLLSIVIALSLSYTPPLYISARKAGEATTAAYSQKQTERKTTNLCACATLL